jgi:hypothetical protein
MKKDSTDEITYLLATIGSLTERGVRVTTATGGSAIAGLGVATRAGGCLESPPMQAANTRCIGAMTR